MRTYLFLVAFSVLTLACQKKANQTFEPPVIDEKTEVLVDVTHLLTTGNKSSQFNVQKASIQAASDAFNNTIEVDVSTTYQAMDGFGFALTGGSAQHLSEMSESAKSELLNELFGDEEGQIGMSFIRISLGASDLDERVFSYNDLPSDQTDVGQEQFSIAPDRARLIPLLKEILAINPDINIMASPWSAPAWMKENKSPKGGSLDRQYFASYALYLKKYIQEMQKEGITITHMSVQNEPLHDGNNPSMYMTAAAQADFIKNHLGPLFVESGISTKILVYDHNPDRIDFPLAVLGDEGAKQYVDGSAFHLYGGSISALSTVHDQHPDKNIYFTEQWFGAPGNFSEDLKWHTREVVIGSIRNWSKSVIEWNLSSRPDLKPHTNGGCNQCLGGITIDADNVDRNAGYYVIAHVSKYVTPGSLRIATNEINDLPNVAFLTPNDQIVLLVLNNTDTRQIFNVLQDSTSFSTQMDPEAVSTFVWSKL